MIGRRRSAASYVTLDVATTKSFSNTSTRWTRTLRRTPPAGPMAAVRRTALYERHLAAGGRMVDFAGWEMPLQYSSVKAEQQAVRAATGIFDVSHMGRLEVQGQGSLEFLQGLVTNDLSKLLPDQAQYNLLCREDGGIVDDLVVYRAALPLRSAPTLPSPTRGEGKERWLLG